MQLSGIYNLGSNVFGMGKKNIKSSCAVLCMSIRRSSSSSNGEVSKRLSEKFAELENDQRRYEYDHQRALSVTTVPDFAPRSAKENATATPWTGEETAINASQRMLNDSIKPLKVSLSQRLSSAREKVLDYTLNSAIASTPSEKEVSSKKSRQRSGTYGAASSGLSSSGWIESIASQEIENAMKLGLFDNIARGEKAQDNKKDLVKSSLNPQLDFTEYMMNNIIKKQGGAPPWIMKQVAVRESIERFRGEMKKRLQERVIHRVMNISKSNVQKAIELAESGVYTRDPAWEVQYEVYHREKVSHLNSKIRGYNIQAPTSVRSGYLDTDSEIERCYKTVCEGISREINKFAGKSVPPATKRQRLHVSIPPKEPSHNHYGLKELIRDLFYKKN